MTRYVKVQIGLGVVAFLLALSHVGIIISIMIIGIMAVMSKDTKGVNNDT